MKKTKLKSKRIISFLIISVMLFSSLSVVLMSCGEKTDDSKGTETTNNQGENSGDGQGTEKLVPDNLPDQTFNNYEFKFLYPDSTEGDWLDWIPRDIAYDAENADKLNDAVFRRNQYIEDKYKIKIVQVPCMRDKIQATIKKSVATDTAETASFDGAYTNMREAPSTAQTGYFQDLNQLPYLDLTKPWWGQNARKNYSVANKKLFS